MIAAHDGRRPLTIAHRAGNDLSRLRQAERLGVDLIEADVWLYRARLEVRHHKTLGPAPVLWDRWSLARGWTPRLGLAELVRAARPETVLFLDLKGRDVRLSSLVIEVFDRDAPARRYAVCSQTWHLLAPFEGRPEVTVAYSVGSRRQLRRVIPLLEQIGPHAVSIHARLLDPATVRALKAVASLVIPWAVNDEAQMRQLLDWGVDGINSENLHLLRILRAGLLETSAGLDGEKDNVTGTPPHQVDG